jgi:ribonuclease Y
MVEIIAGIIGVLAGAGGVYTYNQQKSKNATHKAEKEIAKAERKASDIILKAKDEALKLTDEAQAEAKQLRRDQKKAEERVAEREINLDKKLDELDKRAEKLRANEDEVEDLKNEIREIRTKQQDKLEKIAKLTKKDAADHLIKMTERDIKQDLVGLVEKLQKDAEEDAEDRAQMIILTAMERMSSEVTAERTVTALKLPDDEMKGRIIGKEGRNIQAIQRATGVDVMVDDTPGMVVLSSFDPVRRQIARLTMEMLMKDGRIHPGRIEEVVEKARKQIDKEINQAGQDAAREVGVVGIPKEMLRLLGELKYRTSYGQNVLKHSTEMAQIAGVIAEEIGADVRTAKIATLLHDVGKCRNCRTPISKQYALVEGVTALLFAGVAAQMNVLAQPVTALLWLVLVSLGMIIAVYDIRHYVIPEIPLMLFLSVSIAIGLHVAAFVLVPLPFLLLWIISRGAWIGFGDIELMACTGMLLGITGGIASVVSSFWLACLVILPWYAIQKLRKKNVSHKVPFGPFLLAGIYLVGILGVNVLTMITGMVK